MAVIRVYTLAGMTPPVQSLMPGNHLSGQLFAPPFERRDIAYRNIAPVLAFVQEAQDKVHAEAGKPGQKVFVGHSEGAEVLCRYLRTNPDVDPADNVFVLSGNPERKYGGKLTVPFSGGIVVYDGVGIPDDTPFTVYDIARQYDHFADYPTVNVKAAIDHINDPACKGIHVDYSDVRIGDPRNVGYSEGNRVYLLQPTFPLPGLRAWAKSAVREAAEDAQTRPAVEKGYNRPMSVPPQTVKWYGPKFGYDTTTRRFVRREQTAVWNPFA